MTADVFMPRKALHALLDRMAAGMPVIGPTGRTGPRGLARFGRLDGAADLAEEYTTTTLPPKPETRAEASCVPVRPRAARGVGVVEAPRGTLFHEYVFDASGVCEHANLV